MAFETVALFSLLPGCASKHPGPSPRGSLVAADLPLASYVKMGVGAASGEETRFFFPQLQVWDAAGRLVYSSHEAVENAKVLEGLPSGIARMRPMADTRPLSAIIEKVPAFRQKEAEILGRNRVNILSVFLQDCEACSVQEEALGSAQRRVLDRGMNLLIINLSRPGQRTR